MKIEVDPVGQKFILSFQYDKHLIEDIKLLYDRRYNPVDHSWAVGFHAGNLDEIMDVLAKHNWPAEVLNLAITEAKAHLATVGASIAANQVIPMKYKPTVVRLGELIMQAYIAGEIDNNEQVAMVDLINHVSLSENIKK